MSGPVSIPGIGDVFRPGRRPTRVVRVGDVAIGGDHPIVIQSMTNTDTMDTDATVAQSIALAEAGCELVRVTAPSIRDAENLREIKARLRAAGVRVPLVADIHFTPNAAMIAAEVVEKVRVNPGNYADKKKFEVREYDDAQYAAEIERVQARFRPLVQRCKANGVALRIGTNHGSLSDRIMNRFGDTAEGMVESALEFLDVCEDEGYRDVVFSMKASNTQVAIQAYRLLAARLEARAPGEPSYPFHVGVTEAGDAEDGRIKSAIGIGALLEDGLGDTIRVSLTEDPVREVPVARAIAERTERVRAARRARAERAAPIDVRAAPVADFFAPARRETAAGEWGGLAVGGHEPVRVEIEVPEALAAPEAAAATLATDLSALRDVACESLLLGPGDPAAVPAFRKALGELGVEAPLSLRIARSGAAPPAIPSDLGLARLVAPLAAEDGEGWIDETGARAAAAGLGLEWELHAEDDEIPALVGRLAARTAAPPVALSLAPVASLHAHRVLAAALRDAAADGADALARAPIVLRQAVEKARPTTAGLAVPELSDATLIDASVRLGGLLCDGIGDVVSLRPEGSASSAVDLAYRVLQGARQRTTRTEYISCPSCGRTLFDLEEITARIKARTDHLPGVKIAVMGCIVNGPGEMADADFGYVGSGVGQVTLYVGQDVVARAVPEAEATDRLVELIREHGRWVDPPADDEARSAGS